MSYSFRLPEDEPSCECRWDEVKGRLDREDCHFHYELPDEPCERHEAASIETPDFQSDGERCNAKKQELRNPNMKKTRSQSHRAAPKAAPGQSKNITTLPDEASVGMVVRDSSSPLADGPLNFRAGTKSAKMMRLLARPSGATTQELMSATGWRAHSVRGFLSGTVRKKMGSKFTFVTRKTGKVAYKLRP